MGIRPRCSKDSALNVNQGLGREHERVRSNEFQDVGLLAWFSNLAYEAGRCQIFQWLAPFSAVTVDCESENDRISPANY